MAKKLKQALLTELASLRGMSIDDLLARRYGRLMKFGRFRG
jgi:acetyl-CoA carboxylase alpha subunit